MANASGAALFYDADDRVRVAIHYGNAWRHVFWTKVVPEGDVYCSFGYGEFTDEAATGAVASEGTTLTAALCWSDFWSDFSDQPCPLVPTRRAGFAGGKRVFGLQ
jgi:hypothetical protein